MDWKTLLAYITGSVDQELLLRNEYLVTENRILKNQIKGRLQLTTRSGSVWPRSASDSAGGRWKTWHRSFDLKRFLGGTGRLRSTFGSDCGAAKSFLKILAMTKFTALTIGAILSAVVA